ncbi:EF-hand domain-containing protein [Bosea sp. LjRoot9]|uniref:EF-hand domain-containing protein n=1 Tax=Bosea sp. LjRoot9 TaxID=3342341 RepID=UPI003ED152CA
MSSIGSVGGFRPPPPKPPSFDTLDGDSSGSLSLDEFQSGAPKGTDTAKSEALFKAIDSDSDGSVTKAESDAFKAKAEKAGQQLQSFLFGLQSGQTSSASDSTTSDETDIFSQIDANSDGSIAKDEFTQAFSMGTSDSTSALGDLFDAIDSDSDGSISKDEQTAFQDTLKAAGPPPPPPPAQDASSEDSDDQDIFSQLDANSDGSVAKDEFLSALSSDKTASSDLLSKLFDAIDSDKNGSISKDEQTAFQQASDKRGPPPQPSAAFLNASQSYGNVYQLGASSSATSSYSQAA